MAHLASTPALQAHRRACSGSSAANAGRFTAGEVGDRRGARPTERASGLALRRPATAGRPSLGSAATDDGGQGGAGRASRRRASLPRRPAEVAVGRGPRARVGRGGLLVARRAQLPSTRRVSRRSGPAGAAAGLTCPDRHATLAVLTIRLNGEPYELPGPLSVAALLAHLQIDPRRVAVERNTVVVRRSAYDTTIVEEGDEIEIVNIVGGGADAGAPPPARRRAGSRPGRDFGADGVRGAPGAPGEWRRGRAGDGCRRAGGRGSAPAV